MKRAGKKPAQEVQTERHHSIKVVPNFIITDIPDLFKSMPEFFLDQSLNKAIQVFVFDWIF